MNLTKFFPAFVAAASVALGLCGPACADLDAYVATANGNFGWIDLTTGTYTQIGSLRLTSPNTIYGMGFIGGALIGGDSNSSGSLYTINTATGAATLIGALSDGTNAYSVVGGTGVNNATFVGVSNDASSTIYTALPTAPPNVSSPQPLGFEGDGLVAADSSGANIYVGGHNKTSSDSLYVLSGTFLNDLGGLGANAVAGVLNGGTLYTTDGNTIYSYTVSPTSLSGILATTRITRLADDAVDAMVVSPVALTAVPEPPIWTMMLVGFAGLRFAGYRRARTARR